MCVVSHVGKVWGGYSLPGPGYQILSLTLKLQASGLRAMKRKSIRGEDVPCSGTTAARDASSLAPRLLGRGSFFFFFFLFFSLFSVSPVPFDFSVVSVVSGLSFFSFFSFFYSAHTVSVTLLRRLLYLDVYNFSLSFFLSCAWSFFDRSLLL